MTLDTAPITHPGHDTHAPRFHFVSPTHRCECFDPNGAIYWRGRYHLFYIFQDPAYCTGSEFWQRGHCWGHASSSDLIHWKIHPTALAPEPGDPEAAIYSGCALVNKKGVPTIVYHGYGVGTCIATALDDDLIRWQKSPHNPVIPEPKQEGDAGWGIYNVFDPHAWLEGETYYAILGGKVKPRDDSDTAYLFRSNDLVHWEYLHPFYTPDSQWTTSEDDCACPDFFPLGGQHALVCISHAKGTRCYLGKYRDQRFFPQEHQLMNWPGGCSFAPETLLDNQGRRILFSWAVDQRRDWWQKGELGVMTLPRELSLDKDGNLQIKPAVEFESLRRNLIQFQTIELAAGQELSMPEAAGERLEIMLEAELSSCARLGLKVRVSPDGCEQTAIVFDSACHELVVDVSRSSLNDNGWRPDPMDFWRGIEVKNRQQQRAPLALKAAEPLRLRVFLDHSMLEVFANNRLCLTQRIYPTLPESSQVAVFAESAKVKLSSLQIWQMAPTASLQNIESRALSDAH